MRSFIFHTDVSNEIRKIIVSASLRPQLRLLLVTRVIKLEVTNRLHGLQCFTSDSKLLIFFFGTKQLKFNFFLKEPSGRLYESETNTLNQHLSRAHTMPF